MTHVLKKMSKLKVVMVPAMPVVVHVNYGPNGVHAMLHVVLELKLVIVLVALIKDVLMQHKIDRVIPVPLVQIVLRVKIGLNGAFAVPHVVQEQEHGPNRVVMQVVQIIPKVKTVTPTIVQSSVKQIAIIGVRGHLVVLPVVVVFQQGRVVARHRLKMYVSHRKIKIVEWIHVHLTLVFLVLVQLVAGLNGDSAVRHVVVEFKIDSGCCAAPIAIPKKNGEYVRQIHVAVQHVMNAVILGAHGASVVQHVMDLKREPVLVAYMLTVQTMIPR